MTKKQQSTTDLKKNKKWISIMASPEFGNVQVGETYVENPEGVIGKTVETNLMVLTNDSKRQSNNVKFRITSLTNNVLNSELIGYHLQRAQLKRLTRAGKLKVEDSNEYTTKDGVKIKVKPIFITKAKTNQSRLTALRLGSRKVVEELAKNNTYSQIVKELISGNLQKEIKHKVNKIYPLASCILKAFEKV